MAVEALEVVAGNAELAVELAGAQDLMGVLAILTEAGREYGYDVWLVVAASPSWQGHVFSTEPVTGRAVQWHARNLVESACGTDPALPPPPPRNRGAIPVHVGCADWAEPRPDWKFWHDYAVSVGGRWICTARVGAFEQPPEHWEPAEALLRSAAPYLAFHVCPPPSIRSPMVDPVTGLYSAEFFYEQLTREVQRAAAYAIPLTLALIDLVPRSEDSVVDNATAREVAEVLSRDTRRTD
ncbi:MAG: GGDEF domain-containing protein, partial [Armatimonadetes bacterium]|nr:GGDEF domain-containing protein [Armatimonadota bacterium]